MLTPIRINLPPDCEQESSTLNLLSPQLAPTLLLRHLRVSLVLQTVSSGGEGGGEELGRVHAICKQVSMYPWNIVQGHRVSEGVRVAMYHCSK